MITIDGTEVKAFADQLRHVPPHLRRELRKEIKEVGGALTREVQGNASWSSRIPGATKIRVGFGARSSGVLVYVDAGAAPHARPLEFGNTSADINRHPVFNRDIWVDQPTRPFFMRAVRAAEPKVINAVQSAIERAFARL